MYLLVIPCYCFKDYYNFNPGQLDIATGLPDDDNCLFAIIGWAKPFYSRGSIKRMGITTLLNCCKDSDCVDPNYPCECNECNIQVRTSYTYTEESIVLHLCLTSFLHLKQAYNQTYNNAHNQTHHNTLN